jgi:hypothetical protein
VKETEQGNKIIPEATFGVLVSDYTLNNSLKFIAGKVEKTENSGSV